MPPQNIAPRYQNSIEHFPAFSYSPGIAARILAYSSRRLLDRAVAVDVTSEVFLKIATAIRGFPGTMTEDLRRWLFRIISTGLVVV